MSVAFKDLPKVGDLFLDDLEGEDFREYDFGDRTYKVDKPVGVYIRAGGSTHRVVDANGVVHCVKFCGDGGARVVRWKPKDIKNPVQW